MIKCIVTYLARDKVGKLVEVDALLTLSEADFETLESAYLNLGFGCKFQKLDRAAQRLVENVQSIIFNLCLIAKYELELTQSPRVKKIEQAKAL